MAFSETDQIIEYMWQIVHEKPDQYLYAILDAARNDDIYTSLMASDVEYRCLYSGEIPQVLAEAAPYLVRFHKGSGFLDIVIREGWGDAWGIFMASPAMLKPLESHFREFIMARDEAGKTFYFRYYDPRVLRVYLPTCNRDELTTILGPVECFLVEQEKAMGLVTYSFDGNNLEILETHV
jgi:hypothetical protein